MLCYIQTEALHIAKEWWKVEEATSYILMKLLLKASWFNRKTVQTMKIILKEI